MQNLSLNTRIIIGVIILFCVVALVAIIRSKPHNSLPTDPNGGSVTISAEYANSQIVVDNLVLHNTSADDEGFVFNKLTQTPHQFSVTKDGYWPWVKTIDTTPHSSTTLQSFSILISPIRSDVASSSDEYKTYVKQFKSLNVLSDKSVIQSKDGNMALWAVQNLVLAEWLGRSGKNSLLFL